MNITTRKGLGETGIRTETIDLPTYRHEVTEGQKRIQPPAVSKPVTVNDTQETSKKKSSTKKSHPDPDIQEALDKDLSTRGIKSRTPN